MNPYRNAYYNRQAEWHDGRDLDKLREKHEQQSFYYKWYTKDWLPSSKTTSILDIGCGAGQFVYFLKKEGYTQTIGIDLDEERVNLAQSLGLNCVYSSAEEYLTHNTQKHGLITMLNIVEHFTMEELFHLMECVKVSLLPKGRVIVCVPNAVSLTGLSTRYSDITHETCFSPTSLSQLFFCHDMQVVAFRDPWPAPVSPAHKVYRTIALLNRKLEATRLKLMGLAAPKYWSPVIWAVAEKSS